MLCISTSQWKTIVNKVECLIIILRPIQCLKDLPETILLLVYIERNRKMYYIYHKRRHITITGANPNMENARNHYVHLYFYVILICLEFLAYILFQDNTDYILTIYYITVLINDLIILVFLSMQYMLLWMLLLQTFIKSIFDSIIIVQSACHLPNDNKCYCYVLQKTPCLYLYLISYENKVKYVLDIVYITYGMSHGLAYNITISCLQGHSARKTAYHNNDSCNTMQKPTCIYVCGPKHYGNTSIHILLTLSFKSHCILYYFIHVLSNVIYRVTMNMNILSYLELLALPARRIFFDNPNNNVTLTLQLNECRLISVKFKVIKDHIFNNHANTQISQHLYNGHWYELLHYKIFCRCFICYYPNRIDNVQCLYMFVCMYDCSCVSRTFSYYDSKTYTCTSISPGACIIYIVNNINLIGLYNPCIMKGRGGVYINNIMTTQLNDIISQVFNYYPMYIQICMPCTLSISCTLLSNSYMIVYLYRSYETTCMQYLYEYKGKLRGVGIMLYPLLLGVYLTYTDYG